MSQKILVVDDNVDTRELLHLYLTKAGYTVIIAARRQHRARVGRHQA